MTRKIAGFKFARTFIASVAPRPVCVGSASEDLWADPESEMLACIASSKAYGENGFVFEDREVVAGDKFLTETLDIICARADIISAARIGAE